MSCLVSPTGLIRSVNIKHNPPLEQAKDKVTNPSSCQNRGSGDRQSIPKLKSATTLSQLTMIVVLLETTKHSSQSGSYFTCNFKFRETHCELTVEGEEMSQQISFLFSSLIQ